MEKPGVTPSALARMTVQVPLVSGAFPVSGPRRTASTDSGSIMLRLVNQAELKG